MVYLLRTQLLYELPLLQNSVHQPPELLLLVGRCLSLAALLRTHLLQHMLRSLSGKSAKDDKLFIMRFAAETDLGCSTHAGNIVFA